MIRPAQQCEDSKLSELAVRSKGHWGYSQQFLDACREELRVSNADIAAGNAFVLEQSGEIATNRIAKIEQQVIESVGQCEALRVHINEGLAQHQSRSPGGEIVGADTCHLALDAVLGFPGAEGERGPVGLGLHQRLTQAANDQIKMMACQDPLAFNARKAWAVRSEPLRSNGMVPQPRQKVGQPPSEFCRFNSQRTPSAAAESI